VFIPGAHASHFEISFVAARRKAESLPHHEGGDHMDRILFPAHADATTLDVDTTPVMLRLPRGTVVFSVHGEAWLTQERRLDDVILGPGAHFDVATTAPIVVSATRDRATLHIARPVGACRRAARDVYEFARCRAHALRREELSRLGDALSGVVRGGIMRLRAALASRAHLNAQ
jgi:hypothetical protein